MRYESAQNLKRALMGEGLAAAIAPQGALPRAASVTLSARAAERPTFPFAIGLTGRGQKYRLAIRVQEAHPGIEQVLEHVRQRARGECDIRVVGRIVKQQPWHRRKNRLLRIGGSVGHINITAGTLGCFVTDRVSGDELILSNNHVLANENLAQAGDTIIQPGHADGGRAANDRMGSLARFVRLKQQHNLVDAAAGSIRANIEYYYNWLESRGEIRGIRTDPIDEGEIVYKVGRTTGVTRGRVSAIELDGVSVGYDMGDVAFDNQIEIEPIGNSPFSLGGDSGSLICDRYRRAVGLLFAGNDVDATYANPFSAVQDALRVDLVF